MPYRMASCLLGASLNAVFLGRSLSPPSPHGFMHCLRAGTGNGVEMAYDWALSIQVVYLMDSINPKLIPISPSPHESHQSVIYGSSLSVVMMVGLSTMQ